MRSIIRKEIRLEKSEGDNKRRYYDMKCSFECFFFFLLFNPASGEMTPSNANDSEHFSSSSHGERERVGYRTAPRESETLLFNSGLTK